ncbi:MAG: anaerobic glycerol-3-phosphate dehydrogenase subunit B [Spirochaetales bacterium]|nr:anaerobic glycerol-3-phosphate dehydrogenase subunit B [Spirochaetales bacterium]
MKYDIAVIGSGMSGLMASIYLTEQGLKTAVVSRGDPICSLSSGCIDIAGTGERTLDSIDKFPQEHPYNKVGNTEIYNSIQYFRDLMEKQGCIYTGDIRKNRRILTPLGRNRITSLAPFTMEHADIKKNETFHIISFKDIKDFFPSFVTGEYPDTDISIFDAETYTTMGIAAKMDNEEFLSTFVKWINAQKIKQLKIGIPAVLGITKTFQIIKKLEKETGKIFFEIPTLPPSIPGLRLYRNLKSIAEKKGVSFYGSAEIIDFKKEKDKIINITIKKPGRPDNVDANAFILATGSFVSGGLFLDKDIFKETVFNLPVSFPKNEELFNQDFFKLGHPIEKAGILVDDTFKALDSGYNNLFIAGSILAHSETMKYQCGHGMAISTGIAAAKHALEFLGGSLK